jgi:hypothetical protein
MATKVQGLDQRSEKISDVEVQINLLNEKAQRVGENAKQLKNQARARNVKYKVFLVIISVAAMGLFAYLIHKLTKKSLSPDTLESSMSSTFTTTKIRITTESDKSIVTWNPDLIPPDS